MTGRNSRYGGAEGLLLTSSATIGGATSKVVAGASIQIPLDVDFIAVDPKGKTSAAAAGFITEFHIVGRLKDAVSYDTNPTIVRMLMDSNGYNKGPIDHLPVKGYARIKLVKIVNNAGGVTISGLNVEYRMMR